VFKRLTSEHHADHGEAYEGCNSSGVALKVAAETAVRTDPSQVSFNDPPLRQDDEASSDIRLFDTLDLPRSGSCSCSTDALPLITAIGVDAVNEGEQTSRSFVEHQGGAVPVLDIGGMNDDAQQEADRTDESVALAALDLLACIKALRSKVLASFEWPWRSGCR
jgi:hypothetical protein